MTLFSPLSVFETNICSKSLLKMIYVAKSFNPLTFSFNFHPVKLVSVKNRQLTVCENKFFYRVSIIEGLFNLHVTPLIEFLTLRSSMRKYNLEWKEWIKWWQLTLETDLKWHNVCCEIMISLVKSLFSEEIWSLHN